MGFLVLASLLWSVSFALIKSSGIDPDLLSAARLGLAALIFVPFLLGRARSGLSAETTAGSPAGAADPRTSCWPLIGIGALQFGVMYVAVMRSFDYLAGFEVALLTVTTPIFVVLFETATARRIPGRALAASLIAVAAALVLRWPANGDLTQLDLRGFALVAVANATWALGQILFRRRVTANHRASSTESLGEFAWMYVGAFAVAGAWALFHVEPSDLELSQGQLWKLLYLGLVPTGVAFYLWNRGALAVPIGTLAVMNNLKVPLAVLVAVAPPFSESFDPARLVGCAALLALALGLATWRTEQHAS